LPGSFPLVALVVLDGWGLAPPGPGNAIELADTPVFDGLWARYPHTTLDASGEAVGLPHGQMGNSEVGHLTIGSGRIVDQDLMRVTRAIRSGAFFENPALCEAVERARATGGFTCLASSPTAAFIRTSTICGPSPSWRVGRTWGSGPSYTPSRTAATSPRTRPPPICAS
jgi:Metalloenzyme superfamily